MQSWSLNTSYLFKKAKKMNLPVLQNIWPFWSGWRPEGYRGRESEKLDRRGRVASRSKRPTR